MCAAPWGLMESKIKHLELIQGVINRLASNSFLIKGWSVGLVSALFALSAGNVNSAFVLIAYVPVLVFWGLDGYFLWQERLYRALYDRVRGLSESEVDFSMNVTTVRGQTPGWTSAVFSITLAAFHGVLLIAVVIVMVILLSVH